MRIQRALVTGALLACAVGAHADMITFTFTGHVMDFSEPGVVVERVLATVTSSSAGFVGMISLSGVLIDAP